MDPVTFGIGLAFVQLILKYGLPMAIDLMALWKAKNDGDITYEKVMSLLDDLKDPEDYFN